MLRSSLVGERVWECGGRGRAICAEGRGMLKTKKIVWVGERAEWVGCGRG